MIRNILLSEELYPEYAEHFRGLSFEELDELAASFKFENCTQRIGLNKVLTEDAEKSKDVVKPLAKYVAKPGEVDED